MSKEEIIEESFSSDEEFDEEDEEGSESSTDVDAKLAEEEVFDDEFFKCYSALKKKDSKIYDESVRFFTREEESNSDNDGAGPSDGVDQPSTGRLLDAHKNYAAPKMTILDHQLNLKEDEIEEPKIDLNKPVSKSFYEKELEEIKKSIEKVSENVDSDEDDDSLLVVKGSATGSKEKRSVSSLLDQIEREEDKDIMHLKEIWSDSSKLTAEEKYLRDYILNKRYIGHDEADQEGAGNSHFSKNIDELSDVDEENQEVEGGNDSRLHLHSEDKNFDKIARIPRNSTKTIRDMVEKQEKKEKRNKKLEKEKKRKKKLKDADCEDVVGDLPTRFHYRETEPNDYGLSAEELLMATDEELEQWVKLKDAIAYKSPEEELALKRKYASKRDDLDLKKKIFKSIYGDSKDGQIDDTANPDKATQSKRKRHKNLEEGDEESNVASDTDIPSEETKRSKKKRKRGLHHKKFVKAGIAPDRLLAYGISKNKLKKSNLL